MGLEGERIIFKGVCDSNFYNGGPMGQDECCTIEKCDIFDFMARYVGLSVLHPGGFGSTNELANECELDKDTSVIDIACGKGTTSIYLAKNFGCNVIGIDISEDLVEEAKNLSNKKGMDNKVDFKVADALELPFEDNTFDFAISQAMLVLVNDQKKAIGEAIRVVKPGGYAGWVELSWRKQPTKRFLDDVSNVICAYCMLNVHTYEGWEEIFRSAGASNLNVVKHSMKFSGMSGMIADEGFINATKVMSKFMFNARVRKRMKTLSEFFESHPEYFGYGIYIVKK